MADLIGEVMVKVVADWATFADDLDSNLGGAADDAAESVTGPLEAAGDDVAETFGEAGTDAGEGLASGIERGADDVDVDLRDELRGTERDADRAGDQAGDAFAGGFDDVPADVDSSLGRVGFDGLADDAGVAGESAGDALVGGFQDVPGGVDAAVADAAPDLSGEMAVAGAAGSDALVSGFAAAPDGMEAAAAEGTDAVEDELDGVDAVGAQAGGDLARGFGGALRDNFDSIRGPLAAGLAVVAGAISAAILGSVVEAAQLDAQLRETVTLFGETGGAAAATLAELTPQVRDLSAEVGLATESVTEGLYNAISAGVPRENVFGFLSTAGELAVAGVTDVNTAVGGLTSAMNAFAIPTAEATDVADTFFAGMQAGTTTVPELSQALFNVSPAANAAGLALDETVAAVAGLTGTGVPTSVATTQIRAALVELGREGSAVGDVFESVAGETFRDFIASGGDLAGALAVLQGEAEATGAQVGDYFGSVEAAGAANVLAADAAGTYTNALDAQANRAGAVAAGFETINEGAARQFELMRIQASTLAAEVGEQFLPAATAVLGTVVDIGDAITELPGPVQGVIAVVGGLTAVVAGLGAAALLAVPRIIALNRTLAATGGIAGTSRLALGGMARFLAGPWGIAIAAAAAVLDLLHDGSVDTTEALASLESGMGDVLVTAGNLSDEFLLDFLRERGLVREFQQLGISLDTVRDAMVGVESADRQVQQALEANLGTSELWSDALNNVSGGLVGNESNARALFEAMQELQVATGEHNAALFEQAEAMEGSGAGVYFDAIRGVTDATEGAGAAAGGAAGEIEGLGEEMDDTTSAGQELLRIMEDLDGGMIDLDRATIRYIESVADLNNELQENGANIDTSTEAGRDNISAILGSVDATRDHITALVDSGATLDEVNRVTNEHVDELRRVMEQAGFTDEQINTLVDRYGLIPEDVISQVHVQGVEVAEARIHRLRTAFEGITGALSADLGNVIPESLQPTGRQHGGPVWPGELYLVGEAGPELLRVTSPGEVFPADTTADVLASMAPTVTPIEPSAATPRDLLAGRDSRGGGGLQLTQNIYTAEPRVAAAESVRRLRDRVQFGGSLLGGRR